MRVLLVSSFVLPHVGGVEQFVATIRDLLEQPGCEVRVLACRRPGEDTTADAVVPTRFIGPIGWPLPIGGLRTLSRGVGRADAVVANEALHLADRAGRARGAPPAGSGAARHPWLGRRRRQRPRPARAAFERTLAPGRDPAVAAGFGVRAGVEGIRRSHGFESAYLPYPLPELPAAAPRPARRPASRCAWRGSGGCTPRRTRARRFAPSSGCARAAPPRSTSTATGAARAELSARSRTSGHG